MRYVSRSAATVFKVAPLALAVAFVPAYAQDGQQDEVAEGAMPLEEVVVSGIRQSLQKAQDIKMNSDGMVDAIIAEDIGKLPDSTAAESIARIPGVQVTRFNDEANSVLIRGLPDVTTTYNGREFFTAELRRSQLQDFPAQALAAIEVYKSGTADQIEPGLAGLVNVRTRRPFDFDGQKIAGGIHYGYNDQSEKSAPSGNILYSNRWETGLGEVGFLGNITYAESEYYNGARYNATWFPVAAPNWDIEEPHSEGGFILPAQVGFYNASGKRSRPSANMAIQWQPTEDLEVYFDGIYQGFRGEGMADNFWFPTTDFDWLNGTGDVSLSNLTFVEGTDQMQLASVTKSGGLPPQSFRSTNENQTDTYQFAIGAEWDNGPMNVVTDLAYTDSRYSDEAWSLDMGLSYSPTVNANFIGDDGGANFSTPWDPTTKEDYELRGYYESLYDVAGESIQWRTDFTFDTGLQWLHTVETGFRYNDRDASKKQGSRYAFLWDLHIPMTDPRLGFLDMELSHDPFRGNSQSFTQYLVPTRNSIKNNHEQLAAFALENQPLGWDAWRTPDWETPQIQLDPAQDWKANEKSYAAYLQGKFYFEVGSIPVDAFAGVRVVQTDSYNRGISQVTFDGETTQEERIKENSYVDVFPNASVRVRFTDELQLRAGFTQTSTKPNFGDLNPALNITQLRSGGVEDPNAPETDYDAEGGGGNPDLEPLTSDNYDISLEYYFSDTGYMSAAVFYRDLEGFIQWYTRFVEDEQYGTIRLNRPENAGEGKIEGLELSASTFLDFNNMPEFLHPFGMSVNATRLEGENRTPEEDGTFGEFRPIPGLSKWTYNASVFYEKDRFQARLSYNLRESWVNWYGQTTPGGGFVGNKTHDRDRLDFSMSYDISDNFGVWVDVANITANPFRNYTVTPEGYEYMQDVRDEGRYYGVGVRFDF